MRTFEAAASGACMLAEDTPEHRSFFGPDGECVLYFNSAGRMIAQANRLLADGALRGLLAAAAHRRITAEGRHTYADRLRAMLQVVPA
jgi:spore maturation protein CgeB